MGIAKSLRKANRLNPLQEGIKRLLGKMEEEQDLNEFLTGIKDVSSGIQQQYNADPVTDATFETDPETGLEEMILGDIGAEHTGAYKEAGDKSNQMIADFILKNVGKKVPPNQYNQGILGLQELAKSKPKQEQIKYTTIGKNTYQVNPDGSINFDEPVSRQPEKTSYDKIGNKVFKKSGDGEIDFDDPAYEIPETKRTSGGGGGGFTNFSQKGYWDKSDPQNPKYISNDSGDDTKGEDTKDASKEYGEILGQYKLLSRTDNKNERKAAWDWLQTNTDAMMDKTELADEVSQIWALKDAGYNYNQAIQTLNTVRKNDGFAPLTDKQKRYIDMYFKIRANDYAGQ